MTVLSAQSIRYLCVKTGNRYVYRYHTSDEPLLDPFVERGVVNGRSYGLGPCSYDVRSRGDVFLPVGGRALASTVERFNMPNWLCGTVLDKSTHARMFVSAFNTHLDPGWQGHLTVELVNLGDEVVRMRAGDPLCQIRFDVLDEPTEIPYTGKYQSQPDHPVGPLTEPPEPHPLSHPSFKVFRVELLMTNTNQSTGRRGWVTGTLQDGEHDVVWDDGEGPHIVKWHMVRKIGE